MSNGFVIDYPENNFWQWINRTELIYKFERFPHKKALEFFFSSVILNIQEDDHLLDAAGGRSGYLEAIKMTSGCRNLYLMDHIYLGVHTNHSGIQVVGGDISSINLPDSTLTKISCHHAFEHFQSNKDIYFIKEIGRLLKNGGKACIIPLFLTNKYVECWNIDHKNLFDKSATLIIDKTASIAGADKDGHFARFYNANAFKHRIFITAKKTNLNLSIVTCRLNSKDLPDMKKNYGSKLNYPLRALVLEKE